MSPTDQPFMHYFPDGPPLRSFLRILDEKIYPRFLCGVFIIRIRILSLLNKLPAIDPPSDGLQQTLPQMVLLALDPI